jgi:DNA-binding NtrC family response regulator
LGISRTSLYRRIESHPQLRKSKDLSSAEITAALAAADGDVDRAARALRISKAGLRLRLKELGGQDE